MPEPESFVGAYYGWRFFKIRNGHLGAVVQSGIYEPGERAVCGGSNGSRQSAEQHLAPLSVCSCGYYAHNTLQDLLSRSGDYRGTGMVLGLVQASGRIIECEFGFRAEYLTPVHLFFQPFAQPHLIGKLRKEWGCKTHRWSWPQDVLKKKGKYPNLVPEKDQMHAGLTAVPFTELDMDTVGPSHPFERKRLL